MTAHAEPSAAGPAPSDVLAWTRNEDPPEILVVALVIAFLAHATALVPPVFSMGGMLAVAEEMRLAVADLNRQEIDVAIDEEPPPPPPPEPEPEAAPPPDPEPEEDTADDAPAEEEDPPEPPPPTTPPDPAAEPPPDDEPYPDDEPPPAAAEAGDVITQDDGPVDLTGEGWSIVDNDGSRAKGGGYVAKGGKGDKPVYDPNAKAGGTPGAKGTGKPGPRKPPPRINRSKPAGLAGARSWNCPFPKQADLEQVDRATATVVVRVGTSGAPLGVTVVADPGYGFGAAARRCAMARRYTPARDRDGKKITSSTPPINVRFRR